MLENFCINECKISGTPVELNLHLLPRENDEILKSPLTIVKLIFQLLLDQI